MKSEMEDTICCECYIDTSDTSTLKIVQCALCESGPDMYEALKKLGLYVAVGYDEDNKVFYYIDKEWEEKRLKALKKAEGK